jgi:hypothetical protein
MNDGASILLSIASIAVGAVPSWLISRMYYLKSGPDLDNALRPLAGHGITQMQALNAIALQLEQSGIGKRTFDNDGNLIAVNVISIASIPSEESFGIPTITCSLGSSVSSIPSSESFGVMTTEVVSEEMASGDQQVG